MATPQNPSSLGIWVRERRKQLTLSQAALAERVGYAESMICSIERGRRRPSREALLKLLKQLQATPDEVAQLTSMLYEPSPAGITESFEATAQYVSCSKAGYTENETFPPEIAPPQAEGNRQHEAPSSGEGAVAEVPRAPTDQREATYLISPPLVFNRSSRWGSPGTVGLYLVATALGFALAVALFQILPGAPEQQLAALHRSMSAPFQPRCQGQPEDTAFVWDAGRNHDSTCRFANGTIEITGGRNTILDAAGEYDRTAPLLLLPVKGNFQASVRVEFEVGSECCRHAGIGLRSVGDTQTWLRLSRTSGSFHIHGEGMIEGRSKYADIHPDLLPTVRDPVVYFRIARTGGKVEMSYSLDGVNWMLYYTFVETVFGKSVELFLTAHAAHHQDSLTARFSEFVITPLP
jgi:transcriptional regulator with XRE-family HTH domain/regulation of enolase protein 1 (concanavalin A-like superfamily)